MTIYMAYLLGLLTREDAREYTNYAWAVDEMDTEVRAQGFIPAQYDEDSDEYWDILAEQHAIREDALDRQWLANVRHPVARVATHWNGTTVYNY